MMDQIAECRAEEPSGAQPPAKADGARVQSVDIVIVGAGLAGTSLAMLLGRAGHSVALIDAHHRHPREFRAERLGGPHVKLLEVLGLTDTVLPLLTPTDRTDVYRSGRLYARLQTREYGFAYDTMINGMRAALPANVPLTVGRVSAVTTGPDRQTLVLADGSVFDARLVVVATGLSEVVRRAVGMRRVEDSKAHSLSIGFNLATPAADCAMPSLTWYGHRRQERIAYLTLFPIEGTMRANFFVYRQPAEAWTKAFRQNAAAMLRELMPEIAPMLGGFETAGAIEVRPIDLTMTEGHRQDGVVLVGDAFCTTCPIPGVGIKRALTDVERLFSTYIPRWLQTPAMHAGKIGAFYDDPVKRAADDAGMASSRYARSMVVDDGLAWHLRRLRNNTARRVLASLRRPH